MLAEQFLTRINRWRPTGAGRHSWSESFPAAGWQVQLTADKVDSLSSLVWEVRMSRTAPPPSADPLTPAAALNGWASAVASRVTGLLEPLKVHEVDGIRNEALLRSVAPSRKGQTLAYYELRLSGLSSVTLARYVANTTHPGREQVAFAITHEALAKLLEDITA